MEDQAIIELYFKRSEQALAESDLKYGHYCGKIALNILRNREDAEECVSDTWFRAWNAIPPERPNILKAFFGRITRNLSLNRLELLHADKRGGGESNVLLDELAECVADAGAAEWSADRAVITDVLNRFLEGLPETNRIVFVRRYWYMETVAEIARELSCGESRVKMMLMRGRRELAKQLKEEGIDV